MWICGKYNCQRMGKTVEKKPVLISRLKKAENEKRAAPEVKSTKKKDAVKAYMDNKFLAQFAHKRTEQKRIKKEIKFDKKPIPVRKAKKEVYLKKNVDALRTRLDNDLCTKLNYLSKSVLSKMKQVN